jgi:hypothetical protein
VLQQRLFLTKKMIALLSPHCNIEGIHFSNIQMLIEGRESLEFLNNKAKPPVLREDPSVRVQLAIAFWK